MGRELTEGKTDAGPLHGIERYLLGLGKKNLLDSKGSLCGGRIIRELPLGRRQASANTASILGEPHVGIRGGGCCVRIKFFRTYDLCHRGVQPSWPKDRVLVRVRPLCIFRIDGHLDRRLGPGPNIAHYSVSTSLFRWSRRTLGGRKVLGVATGGTIARSAITMIGDQQSAILRYFVVFESMSLLELRLPQITYGTTEMNECMKYMFPPSPLVRFFSFRISRLSESDSSALRIVRYPGGTRQ